MMIDAAAAGEGEEDDDDDYNMIMIDVDNNDMFDDTLKLMVMINKK